MVNEIGIRCILMAAMTNTTDKKTNQADTDIEFGRSIIHEEARALSQVAGLLDSSFASAVETILALTPGGRIVVSGIGKAGFVAMKISGTLASIGFPSFYLHPADAIHGDLGRFTKNDIALLLSNSGETSELVRLLPPLKQIGSTIIAITGSQHSALASHSDITLEMGRFSEAGPLGLAPTTSTTVMMALGDALAMTLVERRGFTKEEFAVYHPGGDLGRSLMLVSEIMRTNESLCVVPEHFETKRALQQMTATKGRPGAAAVVDSEGKLIGVFTDGDLRRYLEKGTEFLNQTIGSVCSRKPITILPQQLAQESARIIQERKIDQILVVNTANIPVGLIDIQDLLAHGMIRAEARSS
jgi:arabinose-5-phosphate isomerase